MQSLSCRDLHAMPIGLHATRATINRSLTSWIREVIELFIAAKPFLFCYIDLTAKFLEFAYVWSRTLKDSFNGSYGDILRTRSVTTPLFQWVSQLRKKTMPDKIIANSRKT